MDNLPFSIQNKLKEWQQPQRPGFALTVIRHGQEAARVFGGETNLEYGLPITSESSFRLASLSKMFVGAAVALLIEEGRIAMNDKIDRWFPGLAFAREISVSKLLWHTSGLQDYPHLLWGVSGVPFGDSVNKDELYQLLCGLTELDFRPGSRFEYCNTNYFLLGRLVEIVAEASLGDFCREQLFTPLGMEHTRFLEDWTIPLPNRAVGYSLEDQGFRVFDMPTLTLVGDDGAASTLNDLLLWHNNLVKPKLGGEVFSRLITQPGQLSSGIQVGYGAGHFIQEHRGRKLVWHHGEFLGHQSVFRCYPEEDTAIIMLANCNSISPVSIAREIEDDWFGQLPHRSPSSGRPAFPAEIIPGWYRNHQLGLVVQLRQGESGVDVILNHRAQFFMQPSEKGLRTVDHQLGLEITGEGLALLDGDEVISLQGFSWLPEQNIGQFLGEYTSQELGLRIQVLEQNGHLYLEYSDRRRLSPGKLEYLYTGMYRANFQLWLRRVCFVPLSNGMALDVLNWYQQPCRFFRV